MKTCQKIMAFLLAVSMSSSCYPSVKVVELLGTTAVGVALGAASGLACKAVKENLFPTSGVISFIACWWLWGGLESSTIVKIGQELRSQNVACSPALMGVCLKFASYAAYFGYLDKYVAQYT